MARKIGPKHKVCRRLGERLCESKKCPAILRNYPPGVHGPSGYPRLTSYGIQLKEKQKAKHIYGILERQLRNYFEKAKRSKGDTGLLFSQMLEMRLDNVVYRLGLAGTRAQARQMVTHRHISVNGKRLNIPSYTVRINDEISACDKSKVKPIFATLNLEELAKHESPAWLRFDVKTLAGVVVSIPTKEECENKFNVKTIVEFYSR